MDATDKQLEIRKISSLNRKIIIELKRWGQQCVI